MLFSRNPWNTASHAILSPTPTTHNRQPDSVRLLTRDPILNSLSSDLTILLASFGTQGSASLLVDLNGDQRVDGADLSLLLAEWGSPCDS